MRACVCVCVRVDRFWQLSCSSYAPCGSTLAVHTAQYTPSPPTSTCGPQPSHASHTPTQPTRQIMTQPAPHTSQHCSRRRPPRCTCCQYRQRAQPCPVGVQQTHKQRELQRQTHHYLQWSRTLSLSTHYCRLVHAVQPLHDIRVRMRATVCAPRLWRLCLNRANVLVAPLRVPRLNRGPCPH